MVGLQTMRIVFGVHQSSMISLPHRACLRGVIHSSHFSVALTESLLGLEKVLQFLPWLCASLPHDRYTSGTYQIAFPILRELI